MMLKLTAISVFMLLSIGILPSRISAPDTPLIDAIVRDSPIPPPYIDVIQRVPANAPLDPLSTPHSDAGTLVPLSTVTTSESAVREPERTSTLTAKPQPAEPRLSVQQQASNNANDEILGILCRYFSDCKRAYRTMMCESRGIATLNTGNGYFGAFQFELRTWLTMGGTGLPSDASFEEQAQRAAKLAEDPDYGYSAWPICGLP